MKQNCCTDAWQLLIFTTHSLYFQLQGLRNGLIQTKGLKEVDTERDTTLKTVLRNVTQKSLFKPATLGILA